MQWGIILRREWLEIKRNYKWLWIPAVFILLGLMDPITTYYLPQILDSVGGLPEGAKIEIPTPPAEDVFLMTLGQFDFLGLVVIILSSMGLIAGEIKSGTATMIFVKPIQFHSLILAKWSSHLFLLIGSYLLGVFSSWYYINILFEPISFVAFLDSMWLYGLWLIFVLTVTLFISSMTRSPGAAAGLTLVVIVFLQLVSNLLKDYLKWSPSQLSSYAGEMIKGGKYTSDIIVCIVVSILLIVALLIGSVEMVKRKHL